MSTLNDVDISDFDSLLSCCDEERIIVDDYGVEVVRGFITDDFGSQVAVIRSARVTRSDF